MTVQGLHVSQVVSSPERAGDDMIDLDVIPVREEQPAARADTALSFEQDCHPARRQRVVTQPLRPVHKVAVVGTGRPAHFHMGSGNDSFVEQPYYITCVFDATLAVQSC